MKDETFEKMYTVWMSVSDTPRWLAYLHETGRYTQEELDAVEQIHDDVMQTVARNSHPHQRGIPSTLEEWLEIFPEGREMLPKGKLDQEQSLQKAKGRPIEKVINKYTKLTSDGYGKWKGNCPFHKEKTPSFYVFKNTNKYYCFGCHEGGDTIDFISKVENKELKETIEHLCQMTL